MTLYKVEHVVKYKERQCQDSQRQTAKHHMELHGTLCYHFPVSESGTASSYIFESRTLTGTNTINTRKKGLSKIRRCTHVC